MSTNCKLVIVQEYIPTYRLAFFERLRHLLMAEGIECLVAAGRPRGNKAKRSDAAKPSWMLPCHYNSLQLAGRSIDITINPTPWKSADAVIMGLEGSSLPAYLALTQTKTHNLRVGLWGHVRPYATPGNALDLWLEKMQMEAAQHIFAYTPGGASYATQKGINPNKITTVMNTIDTKTLQQNLSQISQSDLAKFEDEHQIDPTRTLCFVGGLDEIKRIDFLSETLDILWERDPTIRILIGGKGPHEHYLRESYERKQAISLGYLDGKQKALALHSSRAICMPGGIGLIAVDALVAQRPIITTDWHLHGPEAEYLIEGKSRITSENQPASYADCIQEVIHAKRSHEEFVFPTLKDMTNNFAQGIQKLLNT